MALSAQCGLQLDQANGRFDYSGLSELDRRHAQERASAIRDLLGSRLVMQTAHAVVQVGLGLHFVRRCVGRASFKAWIAAEFQWRQPAASKFMRAATVFQNCDCLDNFQPSALYVLSHRDLRPAALAEAIAMARGGDIITKSCAEAIVRKHLGISAEVHAAGLACLALEVAVEKIESMFEPGSRPAIARLATRLFGILNVMNRLLAAGCTREATDDSDSKENSPGISSVAEFARIRGVAHPLVPKLRLGTHPAEALLRVDLAAANCLEQTP